MNTFLKIHSGKYFENSMTEKSLDFQESLEYKDFLGSIFMSENEDDLLSLENNYSMYESFPFKADENEDKSTN